MRNSHNPRLALILLFATLLFWGQPSSATTLIDDEGRTITFAKPFQRIISLYPAHSENLAELGAAGQLLGIGRSDDYPATITAKKRFDYTDNIEKFLAEKPDLILIRPMISRSQPQLIAQLRQTGIVVVSLQPNSVAEMHQYWQKLAMLTGTEAAAARMSADFKAAIDGYKRQIPADPAARPRVYFEAIHDKMKTFAPEAISIFALEVAGGRNVASDAEGRNESNIAPYGKERILAKAAEIDVLLSQVGRMNRVTLAQINDEPGFQLISAVRNKAVFLIEEEIVSRPTMRLLLGIGKIQGLLFPSLSTQPGQ